MNRYILVNDESRLVENVVKSDGMPLAYENKTWVQCDSAGPNDTYTLAGEVEKYVPPPVLISEDERRTIRNEKLRDSDFTQMADSPLTDIEKASWATYRQALRDITEGYVPVAEIVWPEVG